MTAKVVLNIVFNKNHRCSGEDTGIGEKEMHHAYTGRLKQEGKDIGNTRLRASINYLFRENVLDEKNNNKLQYAKLMEVLTTCMYIPGFFLRKL